MTRLPLGPALVGLLVVGLLVPLVAVAQPSPCPDALATAEAAYRERDYAAVEASVLACAYHPDAAPGERVSAYRLLALSLVKQDRLAEARATVVQLLGVDYAYDADLTTDLPLYVGLVRVTRTQLGLGASAPPRPVPAAGAPAAPVVAPAAATVDVNAASAEALDAVPGIGPVLAGRIVAYRAQNGPFPSVASLEAVRGIGPRSIQRMAPYLRTGGAVPAPALADVGEASPANLPPMPLAEPTPAGALVDLNSAPPDVLDTLDGIGPALAARIVAFREANGPFGRVEDVVQVRGIGPKTLERFAHQATVD